MEANSHLKDRLLPSAAAAAAAASQPAEQVCGVGILVLLHDNVSSQRKMICKLLCKHYIILLKESENSFSYVTC